MTEKQLRQQLVDTAISYLGCKESDGSHKKIIDIYNKHKPLARGYKVQYSDAWCATYASAIAIICGLTDIIPTECGCQEQIKLFQQLDSWQENDAFIPAPGDYIFYDWQDSGAGDNKGGSDHVGIVVSVTGSKVKVIEGNMNDSVGYRTLEVNGRYIRGFGVPKYSTKTTEPDTDSTSIDVKVGDVVTFIGTKHYISSNSPNGKTCKPGKAKVTALASKGKHPVHLVAVPGEGSTVYGWVDTAFIARDSAVLAVGAKVKVNAGAKTYEGKTLKSFVYKTTYDVIRINGDRVVIGVGTAVTASMNKKDLTLA